MRAPAYLSAATAFSVLLLVAASACDGDDETPRATPTSTATADRTAPPGSSPPAAPADRLTFHPGSTRTGYPAVDRPLDIVDAGDADSLLKLVRFTEVPCSENPQGIGAPPKCPTGTAAGSPVSVFPLSRCEEAFADPAEVARGVRSALALQPRLYAVHEPASPLTATPTYVVVFGFREEQPSGVFRLFVADDGAVVRMDLCPPPGTLTLQNVGKTILAPP
jgi:hypothetical protein